MVRMSCKTFSKLLIERFIFIRFKTTARFADGYGGSLKTRSRISFGARKTKRSQPEERLLRICSLTWKMSIIHCLKTARRREKSNHNDFCIERFSRSSPNFPNEAGRLFGVPSWMSYRQIWLPGNWGSANPVFVRPNVVCCDDSGCNWEVKARMKFEEPLF